MNVLCLSTHLVLHNPLILVLEPDGHKQLIHVQRNAVSSVNCERKGMLVGNCPSCFEQLEFAMNGI